MANKKSNRPTGLKISRNRNKVTCEWKQPSSGYGDGQHFKKGQKIKKTVTKKGKQKIETDWDWVSVDVGKSVTSRSFTVDLSNFYPYTNKYLKKVGFKVQGNRDKDPEKKDKWTWSSWEVESKDVNPPLKPTTVTHAHPSTYEVTFGAEAGNHNDTNTRWGTHIEYQTCLRTFNGPSEENPATVPTNAWVTPSGSPFRMYNPNTGQTTTVVSCPVNDSDKSSIISQSYAAIRWFRSRVVGPGGKSSWVVDYYVYSEPTRPSLSSANGSIIAGATSCNFILTLYNTFLKPVDYVLIDYAFASPDVDLHPVNPSWQAAQIGGENNRYVTEKVKSDAKGKIQYVDEEEEIEWVTYFGAVHDKEIRLNGLKQVPLSFDVSSNPTDEQLIYIRARAFNDNAEISTGAYLVNTPNKLDRVLPKLTDMSITPVAGSDREITLSVTNHTNILAGLSSVNKIFIVYKMTIDGETSGKIIGIEDVLHTGDHTYSTNIMLPSNLEDSYSISAYVACGKYSKVYEEVVNSVKTGYVEYKVDAKMTSLLETKGGTIPVPPQNVTTEHLGDGNIKVSWDWTWKQADRAEVAWSDYEHILDSNEAPNTYTITSNSRNSIIIRNLELGQTWYFWVRLIKDESSSRWSNVVSETPYSSPDIPTLELSKDWITLNDKFTARWTYVSTDNTNQKAAYIRKGIMVNNVFTEKGKNITISGTQQSIEIDPVAEDMLTGVDYYFQCKVESESGNQSDSWSEAQKISVVEPLSCEIVQTSLVASEDEDILEPVLEGFPFTVTVEGAGDSNQTTVMIVRAENYFLERPDESTRGGYQGELIYLLTQQGSDQITIDYSDKESIYGYFDDEASYYLVARVSDNYGQVVSNTGGYIGSKNSGGIYYASTEDELGMKFRINWDHQAVKPVATIDMDHNTLAAIINIAIPENTQSWSYVVGDVCDIYRKSSDGYTLIYEGAIPGNSYVDPYPTIGAHGGYRIVYRTIYGDSITAENQPAWLDFEAEDGYTVYPEYNIIDFGTARAELMFNADFDNSWDKDFKETKYLGGSIQGDWIAGISKSGTINVNALSNDEATVESIHKLARYAGPCHVRTTDGSNYTANINVSENIPHDPYFDPNGDFTKLISYSLSITRIDSDGLEGITLEEWNNMQ